MRINRIALIVGILALVLIAGCGDKTYPVQGQLVFEDNTPAKELAGFTVMFQSAEHKNSANGIVKADGSFTVGTFKDNDGAMLGKQRVAITPPVILVDGPRPPLLISKKYGDFETSELAIDIKAETNKVTIKLERAK